MGRVIVPDAISTRFTDLYMPALVINDLRYRIVSLGPAESKAKALKEAAKWISNKSADDVEAFIHRGDHLQRWTK